ncbi:hypothetical protein LXL04_003234 [Taraxacum kok-saghyz]
MQLYTGILLDHQLLPFTLCRSSGIDRFCLFFSTHNTEGMNKSGRTKPSEHEDGVDLISNLPDPILHLILSRVPSSEEITRTSILSRRWRYVWTSGPSLDLRYGASDDSKISQFKEFVDRVLLNRSVDLDRLRLSCSDYYSRSTVERWIHATVMRNIKQLELSFSPKEESENLVIPDCLVTCASLEVLKLDSRDRGLILLKHMGFPALRVLYLGYIELFDSDSVEDFLESCPVLEDLTLDQVILHEKIDFLCISCPKLKKLRFSSHYKGCLMISSPELMCLAVTAYVATDIICEGLSSLKEAIIGLKPRHICRLFPGISHLESLNIEVDFLYEALEDARVPALPHLKTLELSATEFYFSVKYLNKIIKHCPNLGSFCLEVDHRSLYDEWGYDGGEYEAKPTNKLTRNVKWIESFKINGEKLKLEIKWWKSKWSHIVATWGKNPGYYYWMSRGYFD